MNIGTKIFVMVVLFYGTSHCKFIPLKENSENLRLEPESEIVHKQLLQEEQRFSRQSGYPETIGLSTSEVESSNLVGFAEPAFDESALAYRAPVGHGSIDPVKVEMEYDVGGNVKEKRCRPRYEPANSILGSTNSANPNLNIVRREISTDIIRRRCESCRNTPKCKNLGNCEVCDRICRPFEDPGAINAIDVLNMPVDAQDQIIGMSESTRDLRHGDPTMVSLSNKQLDIPLNEREKGTDTGLSEVDDRFYTIGSFGPGPVQSLLTRVLKINEKTKLENLIVLAKITSLKKPHTVENPVVIDTAHIFTLNDGKPSPLAMELHPVNADKDVVELTRRLNHDLDEALEHKKQHGKNEHLHVHLSAKEIDEIIKRALSTGAAKLLDSERVGESNPSDSANAVHSEDVGCKKKKDKDDSDEYYNIQPMNYGGLYRDVDSSEEQGFTDRTITDEMPKSISSRHGGLEGEELERDESDNLRKKKKGNDGKTHHLTGKEDGLDDVVGAERIDEKVDKPLSDEIIHVDQDHNDTPIKSDSHTSRTDKLVEHNTHHVQNHSPKDDESTESAENDNERHKGKKGKKKSKKHKKGGHDGGYYGGYRYAEEDPQVGDALQTNDDEEVVAKARSNYEVPMNHEQTQHQDQYLPQNQAPIQGYQAQPQQYHNEKSHQYDVPALPDSYQPEEGYEQQDNYQSEETYYADDSSEEESYDGQDQGDAYQNYGEGYQEPQQQEEGYHQREEQHAPQYNEGYQEPQLPQKQQQSQYQELHQPTYQEAPQKAEQQYNQQKVHRPEEQQHEPAPYPQAQNPVYNHPAPPVEQGTYVPKKPQYNEEPKLLPISPEEKKHYPISQGQENEMPYQGEGQEEGEDNDQEDYEDEKGYDEPAHQEIIIPGLNVDDDQYIVGKTEGRVDEPTKAINHLTEQYSKILREDLTQGVKLANRTAEAINKRINKIIADSKNLTDKERMVQLDEIESDIDNIDDEKNKDSIVGDNLKEFQSRFDKDEAEDEPKVTDPTVGAVLENEHGTFVAKKIPMLNSKHLAKQISEPLIGMVNMPSEIKTPPFVDPKAMVHRLEIDKMMGGKHQERVGCKHKDDSSEEYYSGGYYRRENEGTMKEDQQAEHEMKEKQPQDDQNEEVGCKKKKKDKESEEEIIYVHPPTYNNYGGHGYYRENENDSDRKPTHELIVQPPNLVTNEAIEDRIVGSQQSAKEQPGPSGPFTDEPVDATVKDDVVGCKKKKNKDKESHEEYIYVHPPQPQYNEYGGYRENEDGAERKKPLEKVKEFVEGIVHPSKAARAEKADNNVVQKVSQREDSTELPKSILPALIEGIKQLRNHHNFAETQVDSISTTVTTSTTTERPKQTFVAPPQNIAAFVPPMSPEFNPHSPRQSKIIHPQHQFNGPFVPPPQNMQQFMRPPVPNMHGPIEDNLAMLEAFHNQQIPQERHQQFYPTINERVGASQPHDLLENPMNGYNHNHHVHEDMNFGKMVPVEPADKIHGVESREVNEKTQMFFVGDGIKLPIHVKKQQDGTMHLSIDVRKLCKCDNDTCTNAVEGLANLVPTLEKLNHGKVELEVNEDSFNTALNNLNNLDHGHTMNENRDKSKRSPGTTPNTEEGEINELSRSDSGELVSVFDDERYDDLSSIKKYYKGDLANDVVNLKDNIQKYYDNEDNFKEYMGEHQKNEGFLDEFITKRVELLTNVLSWMKSIAIDEVRQQHNIDE